MQRSVRPMPVTARACMHRTALAFGLTRQLLAAVAAQRWLKELPDPLLPRDTYFAWTRAGAALKRCKAQVSARRCSRAPCSVQRATCSMQRATYNVQHATCNMVHSACSMQRTARSIQRGTCSTQHTPCGRARLPAWFPRREACQVHPIDFAQRSSQCSPAPTRRSGRRLPPSSAR